VVDNNAAVLDLLIDKVYQDGGCDFREYKRSTVKRRLETILHATGSKTCPDYMQFPNIHPEEYYQLAEGLTIKVIDFFRSLYTFAQVANLVIPEVVSHKRIQGRHSLRFRSAACARGEEPYSLATPGYLILSEVETLTDKLRKKLVCLDSKAKIYKKNGTGKRSGIN